MVRYCSECPNIITYGSKSGLCRICSGKKHSLIIKEKWIKGDYTNRNESYRNNDEYKLKVSNTVKDLWKDGIYSKERNKKISDALKGKKHKNKKGRKDYNHQCKICKCIFTNKKQQGSFCDNMDCQTNKYTLRKINPEVELERRNKISKALKDKIPKNLKQNIKSNNLYRQYDMYEIIKKYYPYAEYNFYLKTDKSFRILDTAIPDLKIDFEYNGKVHLMKSVIEKDKRRKKELQELGWRIIIINRNNFKFMDKICIKLKGELYGSNF